jgi:multiple sugar transport system permease protein
VSGAGTAAAERIAATPARDRRKAKAAAAWRRRGLVLLFLSPWLIGFTIFIAIPLLVTIALSFTRYNLLGDPTWVGVSNYERLLSSDRQIWPAIGNTLWFVLVSVPLRVVFALGIAILLSRARRGVGIYRTIFYLPALAPPVAATLGFVYLLNPATGPVNTFLGQLGIDGPLWFQSPDWSKISLAILAVWGLGNAMVIFLAAVLDVPRHLLESAELDGAGRWQRFRWVTLPSISPVVLFIIVIGVIEGLQYFTQAYIAATVAAGQASQAGDSNTLELGYPQGSTLFYPILLYQNGFRNFQMGYASAMAIVLLIVAFTLTVIILRNSRRWVHYGGAAR